MNNSIPNWEQIEGLAKWSIRKFDPNVDYKEYLSVAYIMYDRCKETFKPEKGNFASYYRLRLYGELHRQRYRHEPLIRNVNDSDVFTLNVLSEPQEDGWCVEAINEIQDDRCFVEDYDTLAQEIVEKLDQLQDIDPVKLATIKNCILEGHMLKVNLNDPTYDAAIELISTYLA